MMPLVEQRFEREAEKAARALLSRLGLKYNQASVVLDERTKPATLRVFVFDANAQIDRWRIKKWRGFQVAFVRSEPVRPLAAPR